MSPAPRLISRAIALRLAVVSGLVLATAGIAGTAGADDIDTKRAEAARIEEQIAANGERISILDEDFNEARLEIAQAEADMEAAQSSLELARSEQDALQAEVAARAAELYKGSGSSLALPQLDAVDVREAASKTKYVEAAQAEDNGRFDSLSVLAQDIDERVAELEVAYSQAEARREAAEARRAEVEAAVADQEALLAGVESDIAALIAEEEARREAEAEAAARAAIEESSTPTSTPASTTESSTTAAGQDDEPSTPSTTAPAPEPAVPAPTVSGRAGVAVDTALAQLGKPYQYAAAGPDSFDCSGLTQFAWAAAGVSLPHSSRAQYGALPHVSQSELAPGDLVFYGSPIHHVGIFIGGGQYVHAPQTGDVVKISSIYRNDYTGAARPG